MASTALGKLQGQGLIETTTAGLQQTGAQLATTPMGATMQGRTPSSVKMAGTQPAKVNALAAGMQDVSSVALAGLRETSRIMEGTDAEKALADKAQQATPLGRVDDTLAKKALSLLQTKLGAFELVDAKLDVEKLQGLNFNQEQIDAVQRSVNDLLGVSIGGQFGGDKAGFDMADVAELNEIIKRITGSSEAVIRWDGDEKTLPSTHTMATAISQLFTNESKESMQKKISDAMLEAKAETTIGSLAGTEDATNDGLLRDIFQTPDGQTTPSHDELVNLLAGITGKTADEINGMQIEDVTAAIKSWKESEFKDVAKLREILQSKDASYAQRQLARKELRRLGQIGITAAAEKAGDLEKQIQEGDTISFGGKEWTYEEMFSDPTMIDDLSTWVSNPESAPAELRDWVKSNQDAIANKITELLGDATKGLTEATARVTKNKQDVALPDGVVLASAAYEAFFPGWDKGSLDPHSIFLGATAAAEEQKIGDAAVAKAAEKALKEGKTLSEEDKAKIRQDALNADPEYVKAQKYKLLQDSKTPQAVTLLNNLAALGAEGREIFNQLSVAQMQQISKNNFSLGTFMTNLSSRRSAKNFDGSTNLKNEFKFVLKELAWDGGLLPNISNLIDKNITSKYGSIVGELQKAGLTFSEGKVNMTPIIDQIKGLGAASLDDLINDKAGSIKSALEKLASKIDTIIKNPKDDKLETDSQKLLTQYKKEKSPGSANHPDDIVAYNNKRVNELSPQIPPLEAEAEKLAAISRAADYKDRSANQVCRVFGQNSNECDSAKGEASAAIAEWDRVKGKYDNLQSQIGNIRDTIGRFNSSTAKVKNQYQQYLAAFQTGYDSWYKAYETGVAAKNEKRRALYLELEHLWTGVA